jgi:hypothetical protein
MREKAAPQYTKKLLGDGENACKKWDEPLSNHADGVGGPNLYSF